MTKQIRGVSVDVSAMPRLEPAHSDLTPEQQKRFGLGRHPSMDEMASRTLMWTPDLHDGQSVFALALRESTRLAKRDREIAILRHAWDCGSDYQWALHAEMALAAGLTQEEIERLAGDLDAEGAGAAGTGAGWAPNEVAIIRAVDDLHAACILSDESWAALSEHYDGHQIVELLVLVGSYRLLAYVINSVGVVPPGGHSPDFPGNSFLYS